MKRLETSDQHIKLGGDPSASWNPLWELEGMAVKKNIWISGWMDGWVGGQGTAYMSCCESHKRGSMK